MFDIKIIFPLLIVGVFWFFMFKKFFGALKERKRLAKELEKPVEKTPLITQIATVISKRSDMKYEGSIKTPSHKVIYLITFSFNGETRELEVPKNVFERVNKNQTATLVTSNGLFYSFE